MAYTKAFERSQATKTMLKTNKIDAEGNKNDVPGNISDAEREQNRCEQATFPMWIGNKTDANRRHF